MVAPSSYIDIREKTAESPGIAPCLISLAFITELDEIYI